MGTLFSGKYPRIFDDVVADCTYDFTPTSAQVAAAAQRARGTEAESQWRGIVTLYDCFSRFSWLPESRLVANEWAILEAHKEACMAGWQDRYEAWARLGRMRDELLGAA
jgi:hypothetical protein